jgi:hypothetical protein
MKVFQTSDHLIIKENPGCLWLFGAFFAAIGILFLYGAFNGFVIFGIQTPWTVFFTCLLGILSIFIGLLTIYKTPIHQLEILKDENKVILITWSIPGKRKEVYQFEEIERFCLIESQNQLGTSNWNFGLELKNGNKILVTSLGKHPEDYESKYVQPINIFIGKELPSCQLNFLPSDENEDEIS